MKHSLDWPCFLPTSFIRCSPAGIWALFPLSLAQIPPEVSPPPSLERPPLSSSSPELIFISAFFLPWPCNPVWYLWNSESEDYPSFSRSIIIFWMIFQSFVFLLPESDCLSSTTAPPPYSWDPHHRLCICIIHTCIICTHIRTKPTSCLYMFICVFVNLDQEQSELYPLCTPSATPREKSASCELLSL